MQGYRPDRYTKWAPSSLARTKAGPVTITHADGSVEIVPPYRDHDRAKIVAEGRQTRQAISAARSRRKTVPRKARKSLAARRALDRAREKLEYVQRERRRASH